jgi:hypothetical protein
MTEYVWVRNDRGEEYPVVESALVPGIHERVEGARVVLDANRLPILAQEEEPTPPSKSDSKSAWVDHAASLGADPTEAEAMTKAELINQYDKEQ